MSQRPKNTVTQLILRMIGDQSLAASNLAVLYSDPTDVVMAQRWARIMLCKLKLRGLVKRTVLPRPVGAPRSGPYGEWTLTPKGREWVA